jgi:hypothetical protein
LFRVSRFTCDLNLNLNINLNLHVNANSNRPGQVFGC